MRIARRGPSNHLLSPRRRPAGPLSHGSASRQGAGHDSVLCCAQSSLPMPANSGAQLREVCTPARCSLSHRLRHPTCWRGTGKHHRCRPNDAQTDCWTPTACRGSSFELKAAVCRDGVGVGGVAAGTSGGICSGVWMCGRPPCTRLLAMAKPTGMGQAAG